MNDKKEKALLVGVNVDYQQKFSKLMDELENLALACDIEVVGRQTQNLIEINKPLYLGKGKAEEIAVIAKELNVDVVIFNNELSHTQLRNLQKIIDCPILDRTSLILDIFSRRARTKEAKLQVEVARLEYMLPRLVGLHSSLGRQGGGAGLSNKGSGEKKLELDRRRIEDKLTDLKRELEELAKDREIQRKKREESDIPLVSLVGYTNAGKSSLMNYMIDRFVKDDDKKVLEEDMLFATLETSVRKIELEDNRKFLLSDTVGFISELPHDLVKAFRSTLEEIKNADLLLQVVDYSDPDFYNQMQVTKETLEKIGASDIPVIYVYNKSELMLDKLPLVDENEIYLSIKEEKGMDELLDMVIDKIFSSYKRCKMLIPFSDGSVVSYLNEHATVMETDYNEQGTILTVECRPAQYEKYKEYVIEEVQ
ncbi:MAG: GTPase HflX [Clostridia bacterium]|nr:GTPase HflX [Clostridia bacterium]